MVTYVIHSLFLNIYFDLKTQNTMHCFFLNLNIQNLEAPKIFCLLDDKIANNMQKFYIYMHIKKKYYFKIQY